MKSYYDHKGNEMCEVFSFDYKDLKQNECEVYFGV